MEAINWSDEPIRPGGIELNTIDRRQDINPGRLDPDLEYQFWRTEIGLADLFCRGAEGYERAHDA